MSRPGQRSSNLLIALVKSYGRDLKHWLGGLTTRYAAGAGLIAAGVVLLLVAAGVAISAGFHALEIHYGTYVAYGVVGGAFLPRLAGYIADVTSLRAAYAVPLIAYLCISAFGFAAARALPGAAQATASRLAH